MFCDQDALKVTNPKSLAQLDPRVSCLAVPPWRLKDRFMNGILGEVSFRAVFAPVDLHATQ